MRDRLKRVLIDRQWPRQHPWWMVAIMSVLAVVIVGLLEWLDGGGQDDILFKSILYGVTIFLVWGAMGWLRSR